MTHALIWGFEWQSQIDAVKTLQTKALIDIRAWVVSSSKEVPNRINMVDIRLLRLGGAAFSGLARHCYNDVKATCFTQFMEMYSRNGITEAFTYHDYIHAFNALYDYFARLLVERDIQLLLFSYLPHFGDDLVLYTLAKALGVKTLLYYQSHVPGRLYSMTSIEDYGRLETMQPVSSYPAVRIERKHEKQHFYMNKKSIKVSCAPRFLSELRRVVFRRKNRLPLISVLNMYAKCRTFRRNLKRYARDQVDMGDDFVYFPLHLQPELTTSTLGGVYCDQLLAIEALQTLLPEDWTIIVKENPKQLQKQRSPLFFERLRRMPNVVLASARVDTYELTEHCRFVATITGTAGWEAISGGKNVLVFGKAWYRSLPGVFEYGPDFDLEALLDNVIDHEALESAYNAFLNRTAPGVLDKVYNVLVDDYSDAENTKILAQTLEQTVSQLVAKESL